MKQKNFLLLLVTLCLGFMQLNDVNAHAKHEHEQDKKEKQFSHQKPGAIVSIDFPKSVTVERGVSTAVNVEFFTPVKRGTLKLSLRPTATIFIESEQREWVFDLASEPVELEVLFHTTKQGIDHLMFAAEHTINGDVQTRSLGVSVLPHDYEDQKQKRLNKPKASSGIIRMPAEEKIYTSNE